MKKNIKKKDNFGKNFKKKKKTWEKLKLNSQPTQYLKNKFNKDNFKTKHVGEILQTNKNHVRETLQQFIVFFFLKKATKLSSQPAQYKKKMTKTI